MTSHASVDWSRTAALEVAVEVTAEEVFEADCDEQPGALKKETKTVIRKQN